MNYNWRGQGMSSVFLDGAPGDISLGNTSTEIDWPAATQAATYYAPSPDATPSSNAKRWLGTFVANGQGTTGMLYRRNRYFDPKSGQFTQADPIGIAGGMNAFGFANGDPVNFSDPFGLCPLCVVLLEEVGRGAIVGGVSGAITQIAANEISGAPTFAGVGEAAAVGAAVGAVTAGFGSAVRIGKAIAQAQRATGFGRAAMATEREANLAGRLFTGRPSRPIYEGRAPGRPQVGMRNDATGNQYRSVTVDRGNSIPHANLQNAQGGNVHVEVNSSVRWRPWMW